MQAMQITQADKATKVRKRKATLEVQPAIERKESLSASGSMLGMDIIDVARLVMYADDSEYEPDGHETKSEHEAEHEVAPAAEVNEASTKQRRNSSPRNHRFVSWKLAQSATGPTPKSGGIGGCCSNSADEQERALTTTQKKLLKVLAQTDR